MEQKEAMGVIYDTLQKITYVELDGAKTIYTNGEQYMVAIFNDSNSSVSPVFETIEEAKAW